MAAWLATHPHAFEIGAVVTAGSPVGGMGDYPAGTHVLSLENRGDLVPLTDGEANPDAGNHVTVTFDDRGPDLVGQPRPGPLRHRGRRGGRRRSTRPWSTELARLRDARLPRCRRRGHARAGSSR